MAFLEKTLVGKLSINMRIISGKLKGKNISFIKSLNTRPLKDSVRENIFNILSHSNLINIALKEANILDLYSGVGSFGLEALSRGAKKVTFVEKDKVAIEILSKNLKKLNIESKAILYQSTISQVLQKEKLEKYNLFFLDPPFADKNYINEIGLIKKNKIFKKDHVIIIHREKQSDENIDKDLSIFLVKNYGRSKIIFANF